MAATVTPKLGHLWKTVLYQLVVRWHNDLGPRLSRSQAVETLHLKKNIYNEVRNSLSFKGNKLKETLQTRLSVG